MLLVHYIIFGKIIPDMKRPSAKRLKECCKCAKDISFDRIWGKMATVTFNICASHLGTELYALHEIGYAIATSAERKRNYRRKCFYLQYFYHTY